VHVVQSKLMEKCYAYMEKGSTHSTAGTFVSVYIRNDLLDQFSSGMFQKRKKNKISYAYKTESLHKTRNVNLKI
jgi:hypothetical protein